ncbi:F0F1 ATP synthase subunit gamma, partial [Patescibacteria group bacterium]
MATIREIKEEQTTVRGVGEFATSLQHIAAGRMVRLRKLVLAAKRFADEATVILRELELERTKRLEKELGVKKSQLSKSKTQDKTTGKTAIFVISSDQGLCGSYNIEIIRK